MNLLKQSVHCLTLAAILLPGSVRAQYVWNTGFDNGILPEGMQLRGNAAVQSSGGQSGGCLVLTPSARGSEGDAVLPVFWPVGETPAAFTFRCAVKMSGNSGGVIGDGWSVSLSDGVPSWMVGENGTGNGPKFSFDTWAEASDGLDGGAKLWVHGAMSRHATSAAPNRLSAIIGDRNDWHAVEFSAQNWRRQASVRYRGDLLLSQPGSDTAAPILYPDGRLILGARTGDAFNAHLIDSVSVSVTPYPVFRSQPQSVQVTSGSSIAFTAQTNFNVLPWQGMSTFTLAASASTVWQARHPGGSWADIPGTAEQVLWGSDAAPRLILRGVREDQPLWDGDDPALSADGTEFRCVLSWHNQYTAVSLPARLSLMTRPTGQPGAITLFNAFPAGHAQVTFPHEEGKVLRLTPASADCLGGFVFEEISRDAQQRPQLATAFSAEFQYRGSLGSTPRADGFSFNVATDLPGMTGDIPPGAGEEGAGTGLTVSFDAYENAPGDPAGIEIRWRGMTIHRLPLPADTLFTDDWVDAFIRVEPDGTLDLALHGQAVIADLPLPAWAPLREPKMAFYGRTGALWQQQDIRELAVLAAASPIVEAPPAAAPQPGIFYYGAEGRVTVFWTNPGPEVWQLMQSADLVNWVPAAYPVYDHGGGLRIMHAYPGLPGTPSRLFFRLVRP